jgi:peptidoglycan glycosyltransferase
MAPYVVNRLLTPEFEVVDTTKPHAIDGQPAVSAETAAALTQMMIAVVNDGTGRSAALPGVQVAGKTGTAQNQTGAAPHAWFIGFAPAEAPRVAVAVIVERGGDAGSEATGGRVAAPIAREVMAAILGSG